MIWAAIGAAALVALVFVVALVRRRNRSSARTCLQCRRSLLPGWVQCPFCGASASGVQIPGMPAISARQEQAFVASPYGSMIHVPPTGYDLSAPAQSPLGGVQAHDASGQARGAGGFTLAPGQWQVGPDGYPAQGQPPPGQAQMFIPPIVTAPPPDSSRPWTAQPHPGYAGHSAIGRLDFIRGPLVGRSLALGEVRDPDGSIRLGSDNRNSIVLPDPSVSRRHATIRLSEQGIEMADLGSTNGMYVNGAKVARHRLNPGDVIRLGGCEMVFR